MHDKVVEDWLKMIENKTEQGEQLKGFEAIEKGSKLFWSLPNSQKEQFLELNDNDF